MKKSDSKTGPWAHGWVDARGIEYRFCEGGDHQFEWCDSKSWVPCDDAGEPPLIPNDSPSMSREDMDKDIWGHGWVDASGIEYRFSEEGDSQFELCESKSWVPSDDAGELPLIPNGFLWVDESPNDLVSDVYKFNTTAGTDQCKFGQLDIIGLRAGMALVCEEIEEIEEASVAADLAGVYDGIADAIYVLLGMAYRLNMPFYEVWKEVHEANMRKFPDGKVTKDANGKVQKPEGWVGPDIEGVIVSQS